MNFWYINGKRFKGAFSELGNGESKVRDQSNDGILELRGDSNNDLDLEVGDSVEVMQIFKNTGKAVTCNGIVKSFKRGNALDYYVGNLKIKLGESTLSETPATYSTDTKRGTKIRNLTPDEQEKLDNDFTYHPPREDQIERYQAIRNQAKHLAQTILECCPPSSKRDTAYSFVTVASMMANASIATTEAEQNPQS